MRKSRFIDPYGFRNNGLESEGPEISGFIDQMGVGWRLGALSGVLSSVELLTVPPDLELWTGNLFEIRGLNPLCLGPDCGEFLISGEVKGIVPEPATGAMVLLGVLVLAVRRRRSRHE